MIVSEREEALACELYTKDMGLCQGEYMPWERQIDYVKNSYRRQASKVVNSDWFRIELDKARVTGLRYSYDETSEVVGD
jgi:hypothetical protein